MFWNDPTLTLTTPSFTILFNQPTGDTYFNDPQGCSGLDGAPVRFNVEDAPQTDGSIAHPSFKAGRHITKAGDLRIRSATTDASYIAARATLEAALIAACEDILNADGTLSWASGASSLTVRSEILPTFPGANQKTYLFGLFAADPAIT